MTALDHKLTILSHSGRVMFPSRYLNDIVHCRALDNSGNGNCVVVVVVGMRAAYPALAILIEYPHPDHPVFGNCERVI